jgi:hypothetical protein
MASDAPHSEHLIVDGSRLRLIPSSSFSTRGRFGTDLYGIDCFLVEFSDVPGAPPAVLAPEGVPIGSMRTPGASFLATTHPLLTKADVRTGGRFERESPILEPSPGQDEETPQIVLIHLTNCLQDIPIDRH